MQSTALLASIGMFAALLGSSPVLAGDRDDGHRRDRDRQHVTDARPAGAFDQGMQAVRHDAGPGEWGHGWQYFSDPTARRAVVISPQGDYYYSRGKGLRWIAAAQSRSLEPEREHRPATGARNQPDVGAVQLQDPPHDHQPQSAAAITA